MFYMVFKICELNVLTLSAMNSSPPGMSGISLFQSCYVPGKALPCGCRQG